MNKLKLIILLIFAFSIKLGAQNVVHLCIGDNHNFGVPYTNGSSYFWQVQGDPTIATITSGDSTEYITIDLNNLGVFQLLVEEVDVNGCKGYDSILVEIHDLPNPYIFAVGPTSFCEGDSVLLQVDSDYSTFLWNNNATSIYVYADTTANYFVSVTDTNGCSNNSNSIFVNAYPNPIANFIIDGVCLSRPTYFINQSTISSGDITSSIWYLGNGDILNGDSVLYYYHALGEYRTTLLVISDFGCQDSISQLFSINSNPIADFTYSPLTISTLDPEITFINTSLNAFPVLWNFGDTNTSVLENPTHIYERSGIYDVLLTVADTNQCIDSIMRKITMYYDFVLYIPNSFSPNGDGDNDKFGPVGIQMDYYRSYQFIIYNRWGEQVFITDKVGEKWDGKNATVGMYNWVIIIEDELGAYRQEIGDVMLLK